MHSKQPGCTEQTPVRQPAGAGLSRRAARCRARGLAQSPGPPRRGRLARPRRTRDLLIADRSGGGTRPVRGQPSPGRTANPPDRASPRSTALADESHALAPSPRAGDASPGITFADNLARSTARPAGAWIAIARGRADGRSQASERGDRRTGPEALGEELALRGQAARIACVKLATREQLLRRILLAADFIASCHDEPISLDEMARAASLSRFHFVRLFSLVHGETPHAFLLKKRTAVARRHLAVGGACSEAATRAGFGSRSALFRNLRKIRAARHRPPNRAPSLPDHRRRPGVAAGFNREFDLLGFKPYAVETFASAFGLIRQWQFDALIVDGDGDAGRCCTLCPSCANGRTRRSSWSGATPASGARSAPCRSARPRSSSSRRRPD